MIKLEAPASTKMELQINFSIFWLLFEVLSIFPLQAAGASQNLTFLSKSEADACIRCLCDFKRSCDATACDGNDVESSKWCGPFRITKPYWIDGGNLTVPGETSKNEQTRYRNCTQNYNCSVETIRNYSKRYMKDCNEDGKFTCSDLGTMHFVGPNCQGFIDHDTKSMLNRFLTCYASLRGEPTDFKPPVVPGDKSELTGGLSGVSLYFYVGAGIFGLFIVACLVIIYWFYQNRLKLIAERDAMPNVCQIVRKTKVTPENQEVTVPLSIILQPFELVIHKSKVLGQGQFGMVYEGMYSGKAVAVKEPKLNMLNLNCTKDFEKELEMMANVGKHPHIVQFLGAEISQFKNGIVHVVLELSRYGSLLDFMRAYARDNKAKLEEANLSDYVNLRPDSPGVSETAQGMYRTRLRWSYQIASGMAYLESRKIMHGDLAARNVLLFEAELVKLSDFGFARNLENYDEYLKREGPMPWRWMAPESLERRIFSIKSDVWSFGVTLWEIFTFGVVPNGGLHYCTPEYFDLLKKGERLGRPDGATEEIYEVMLNCWKIQPETRPSFASMDSLLLNLCMFYASEESTDYQNFTNELEGYVHVAPKQSV